MGITTTLLLPAGSRYGLAAEAKGNDSVFALVRRLPEEFLAFANELPDIPETEPVLRKYLEQGAKGIGEQKFPVAADSVHIERIAGIAKEFNVPILLHFEHEKYNLGLARFHRILEKYPTVNFIGHAQTWWGNVDKKHNQTVMYPKTPVARGGLTDRYLTEYPNMYGDLSANSGLNSMLRDEEHAREFLIHHQNKLVFGSDCNDSVGMGQACIGSRILEAIRRLTPAVDVRQKLLHANAAKLLRL
jgi:predicted TIM-barrel fold metal-dependent hydrolase